MPRIILREYDTTDDELIEELQGQDNALAILQLDAGEQLAIKQQSVAA